MAFFGALCLPPRALAVVLHPFVPPGVVNLDATTRPQRGFETAAFSSMGASEIFMDDAVHRRGPARYGVVHDGPSLTISSGPVCLSPHAPPALECCFGPWHLKRAASASPRRHQPQTNHRSKSMRSYAAQVNGITPHSVRQCDWGAVGNMKRTIANAASGVQPIGLCLHRLFHHSIHWGARHGLCWCQQSLADEAAFGRLTV